MLGDIPYPIRPVVLDRDTCFFLPGDFLDDYVDPVKALQDFMLIDIFSFKNGKYLPQTEGFRQIVHFAKDYLRSDSEKLKKLYFHNVSHTFHPVKGVLSVALKLAIIDGLTYNNVIYERIGLASALHDIGNIVERQRHESISIEDSRGKLLELGYDNDMINGIALCIHSTAIDYENGAARRQVGCREAKIVSDADLSNPGFYDVTNLAFESIKIWLELDCFDIHNFANRGTDFTHNFFESIGEYYTGAAQFMFSQKRKENMKNLQPEIERIMALCGDSREHLQRLIHEEDDRIAALSTLQKPRT